MFTAAGRSLTLALSVACLASATWAAQRDGRREGNRDGGNDGDRRPKFQLKAQPMIGTTPARIVFTAELVGGADDFEEYYCAGIEWEWGDDTTSESNVDCPPYETGKTSIRRRYTIDHIYRRAGSYRPMIHLKQRSKQVATAMTNIQIRPGPRDLY